MLGLGIERSGHPPKNKVQQPWDKPICENKPIFLGLI